MMHSYIVTCPIDHYASMNMVAVIGKEDGKWEHDEWVIPSSREAMLKSFEDLDPKLFVLLQSFENTSTWALFDHGRASKYYKGRICIMGDAAHATSKSSLFHPTIT